MPAIKGPRKVHQYSNALKVKAVQLAALSGVLTQDVASALDIHPFMLSCWKKKFREGTLVAKRGERVRIDHETAAELKRLRALERENAILKEELTLLKKSPPVLFRTKGEIFAFIEQNRDVHEVRVMCRLYGISRSGYYAWRQRPLSGRAQTDAQLLEEIRQVFEQHDGIYGSPRVHVSLREKGHRVGEKRVARLMHANRLKARSALIYRATPACTASIRI